MLPSNESPEEREQQQAAAQRYREASAERKEIEAQLAAGVRYPDTPERIASRAGRLLERGGIPPTAAVEGVHAEALDLPETLERVIGLTKDLQPWSFLPRGARAAATVARISVLRGGLERPHGTGFLVSPRLLLTNHHVLPDAQTARRCFLEFNAQVTIDNAPDAAIRFTFDPDTFFTADRHLDYALVAVAPATDGTLAGEMFGWNQLSIQQGKLVQNEPVNVIGHPMGRLKEIALRDNALVQRLDDFLHYRTDTEPGNSGSPVYNDQWEVVALHHMGVPRTDAQGRILRKDGQLWRSGVDSDDTVDYVSNEGARTSSILKHLAAQPLDAGRRALLAEMGAESGLRQDAVAAPVETPVAPLAPVTPVAPATPTTPVAPAVAPARTPAPAPREAAPAGSRVGLKAPMNAFGGARHLVFLHGRSQQGKDPETLRRGWTGGLNHGLTRAGLRTVDPQDVWFPYYGDRIVEVIGQHEALPAAYADAPAAAALEAFAARSEQGTYEQLVMEAAALAGMPQDGQQAAENIGSTIVGSLQGALGWLAAKTDVDALAIATIFRDVDAYLGDRAVREAVLDRVSEEIPREGELVLVTHSLGTVVGMDLVANRLPAGMKVTLLVTAGSPLGMNAITSRLLPPGTSRPGAVRAWVNAWCPTDAVAIGCPLEPVWGKLTEEHAVVNASDRAHSIEEYLAHPEVATAIDTFLARPTP
ncbi:trypsin-like serine peptidase [Streptomyces sp. fd1-xmd]|uniref:trypsin-like serine peptidase n=1 Tax=Streptomyces sp. fd1-xmd TaxID=1812480 RepID=UPI0009909D78|nr:serine protease [Streptomyces sp. fd1-xmd]AQT71247.1 serine protease [Streptomyces sp. fd1-xmd]